jgi:hypothetical protein
MSDIHEKYDFFFSYTRQSQRHGWTAFTIVQQLCRLLERCGRTCFFDAKCLPGRDVASCVKHAGSATVLVFLLDDSFPTKWCLKEIEEAIDNRVPIITVFDMYNFTFKEVGKDAWWAKRIPPAVIQAVFAKGTIHFNSHPDFAEQAEHLFEERLVKLWQEQRLPSGPSPRPHKIADNKDQCSMPVRTAPASVPPSPSPRSVPNTPMSRLTIRVTDFDDEHMMARPQSSPSGRLPQSSLSGAPGITECNIHNTDPCSTPVSTVLSSASSPSASSVPSTSLSGFHIEVPDSDDTSMTTQLQLSRSTRIPPSPLKGTCWNTEFSMATSQCDRIRFSSDVVFGDEDSCSTSASTVASSVPSPSQLAAAPTPPSHSLVFSVRLAPDVVSGFSDLPLEGMVNTTRFGFQGAHFL